MKHAQVQALRGLACLMLVFYHVVGSSPAFGLQIQDGGWRYLNDALAAVRMPLFAWIAGAVYGFRPQGGWSFTAGKARRLLVPMLIVGTLFAGVQALTPGTNDRVADWRLLHLLPVAHYWFLESLFLVFCVVAVAQRAGLFLTPWRWCLVFGLSVAAYFWHPGLPWFGISGMFYLLPYFVAGMGMELFHWQPARFRRLVASAIGLACLGIASLWAVPGSGANRFTIVMLLLGLMSSAALWLWRPQVPWLARLGDYSYAVFLFHVFFTAAARIVLNGIGIHSLSVQILAGLAAGMAGPIVVHRLLVHWEWPRFLVLGMARARPSPGPAHRITLDQVL
jgi:surface polysaccharide O-acyltransferase-like enzyme